MKFKANESEDKLRGGYYTPKPISDFLTKWIMAKSPQRVLEPSCGDGVFIRSLASENTKNLFLTAVERKREESLKARETLESNAQLKGQVLNQDFLKLATSKDFSQEKFDAVIGNPPYIRYQYLEKADQGFSEEIFFSHNLKFTKHTNAWVPFIISSLASLAPGGRIAMVVPAEILHVLHASSLRSFMLEQCDRILLIDPNELLFEEALQGTVLLLAEKKLNPDEVGLGVSIYAAHNNDFLNNCPEKIFQSATYISGDSIHGKWMKVLLSPSEIKVYEKAVKKKNIKIFKDIAKVDVGIVTGANKFFLVPDETIIKYELQDFSAPMFGRSEHCKGVIYDKKTHNRNSQNGLPVNFVYFPKEMTKSLPKGAQRYIKAGEQQDLHKRYKCRIRSPWYSVPSVYKTQIGMLKRSHNYPRLILNKAGAYTTDTAYRISTDIKPETLVYCFVNTITALSAELEGRHYGGGVLELVPSEIEKLYIPIIDSKDILSRLRELDKKIIGKAKPEEILEYQDSHILKEIGLTSRDIKTLHNALKRIRSRRHRILDK